jgi:hypothetical protein
VGAGRGGWEHGGGRGGAGAGGIAAAQGDGDGRAPGQRHGVPRGQGDDVRARHDVGAVGLQRPLRSVDDVEPADPEVGRRVSLALKSPAGHGVQQNGRVAGLAPPRSHPLEKAYANRWEQPDL